MLESDSRHMPGVQPNHCCQGLRSELKRSNMERDLLVMIYGAIMGVVGSIITSLVTALFHLWLDRREYERRRSEEQHRHLNQIHLPTDEDVRLINAGRE